VGCDKVYRVSEGPWAGTAVPSLEYETLNAFGANVYNPRLDVIIKANDLCDRLGLDSISTSRSISFLMELAQRGIVDAADADGLDLSWGRADTILELVQRIARREGVGAVLAEGVRRAAAQIGRGAEQYAMEVKGCEM